MTRPEDIHRFIKKLGADVLTYILNLSSDEAKKLLTEGYSLSVQQQDVLNEMTNAVTEIQKVASHQNDPDAYTYFSLSQQTTATSRHVFNEWRERSGGKLLLPLTDDDVVRALTTLAIETSCALDVDF